MTWKKKYLQWIGPVHKFKIFWLNVLLTEKKTLLIAFIMHNAQLSHCLWDSLKINELSS